MAAPAAGLLDVEELADIRLRTLEASSNRMMRELADALAAVSSMEPVVLVCEDLHAADRPTVETLSYLARRRESGRVSVVSTYRPAEAFSRSHPLRGVVADLRGGLRCR